MPHPWKHSRTGWAGHWSTWCSWRCPWSLQVIWKSWPWKVPSNPDYSEILWRTWLHQPVSGVANKRFRSTWLRYKIKVKELPLTWINVSHIIPAPLYPSRGTTRMYSHITKALSFLSKDLHNQGPFLHWRPSTVSAWKSFIRQKQPWPLALERRATWGVPGTNTL